MLHNIEKSFNALKSKRTIKSNHFILVIVLYFGSILNLSLWREVATIVQIDSFSMFRFMVSLIFVTIFTLYVLFSLLIIPRVEKPLIIALLLISSTTNYFMFSYGIYIDSDMVRNIFETHFAEALDLVTFIGIAWLFFTGIVPSILIYLATIEYFPLKIELKSRSILLSIGLVVLIIFAATSYKEYAAIGRNNASARKLFNTLNYIYATARYFQLQSQTGTEFVLLDQNAQIISYGDPYKTVLVLVVGETARAKNFSINGYTKQTNPLLEKLDIINFGNTQSCGTATAISVPCMFSNEPKSKFDVVAANNTDNLLDILHRAGYDVIWLENDGGSKGVSNRLTTINFKYINNPKYCDGFYCYDEILIDGLDERLKNIEKDTVIVLHMMGSHGPTYFKRYTDEFRKFTPTCDTSEIQTCTKEEIANTYDNTILYTDYILASIVNSLTKFPEYESAMLYVSDHGESLGENNIYLHGLPYAIAPTEQTEVPMIIWVSDTMKKYDYIDTTCMQKSVKQHGYSHDNIFHSILGLLEVNSELYDNRYDIFINCRTKLLPYQVSAEQ